MSINLNLVGVEPKFPSEKTCRKMGRQDGQESIPSSDNSISSPFIVQLSRTAAARIEEIGRRLRITENAIRARVAELAATRQIWQVKRETAMAERAAAKGRFEQARGVHEGLDPNRATTVGGGIRIISNFWYAFALIALGIGEFAITLRAFEKVLGEPARLYEWLTPSQIEEKGELDSVVSPLRWNNFNEVAEPAYLVINFDGIIPILVTFAASALFIIYAHFLGIVLKRHSEKDIPQPRWVLWAMVPITVIVFLGALGLAYFRSTASGVLRQSVATELGIAQAGELSAGDTRLFILFPTFLFVQLGLVVVAAAISYGHYSTSREALKNAERALIEADKQLNHVEEAFESMVREYETQLHSGRHVLKEAVAAANRERRMYEMLASAYLDANLKARPDRVTINVTTYQIYEVELPSWLDDWHFKTHVSVTETDIVTNSNS
jgi:hypothetical protein